MKQGKLERERAIALSDTKTTAGHDPHRVFASCPLRLSMKHLSCDGCRYARKGLCADWTVRDVLGGVQRTDDGVRRCYESPQTVNESLVLYLLNHEGVKA